jgi:hypothetical protein
MLRRILTEPGLKDGPAGMWENEACARSTTYLKFGAEQSAPTQKNFSESLILAQNERWQRGLGMQVERSPGVAIRRVGAAEGRGARGQPVHRVGITP